MSDALDSAAAGDGASSTLTVEEYRSHAAAICQSANQRNDRMPDGSPAENIEFAETTARNAYDAFTRLHPPPEFAELHAEMLGLTRGLLDGFPPLVTAAKIGPTALVLASSELAEGNERLGRRVTEIWAKLDVPACYEPHE